MQNKRIFTYLSFKIYIIFERYYKKSTKSIKQLYNINKLKTVLC